MHVLAMYEHAYVFRPTLICSGIEKCKMENETEVYIFKTETQIDSNYQMTRSYNSTVEIIWAENIFRRLW